MGYSAAWTILSPLYGNFDYRFSNPELGPEHQRGGEGGLELYLGTRGSLVVTRYNQTVDGLILFAKVDSVRSAEPTTIANNIDAEGYGYWWQYQYVNVGSIRNQGWELQGSLNTGPFTARGTYSWTKSRSLGIAPKIRAQFSASSYPQYQPGATAAYLPEHTWALGVTYARTRSSIGLNITGLGQVKIGTNEFFLRNLDGIIRLQQNRLNVTNPRYTSFNAPYALADLQASHRFSPRFETLLQVQNLADRYLNDYQGSFATLGRQTKLGLRLRY